MKSALNTSIPAVSCIASSCVSSAMLQQCEKLGCVTSRDVILKLIFCSLDRLTADELTQLPSEMFVQLIESAGDGEKTERDRSRTSAQVGGEGHGQFLGLGNNCVFAREWEPC